MNEDIKEQDSLPQPDLTAADDVHAEEQTNREGKRPDDFIAQAEKELAEKETPPAARPEPQTPQQKALREKTEKMISGWPEEDKKLFAAAPENLRELLGKYYRSFHADYTKKTQQAAALREAAQRELEPLRPLMEGRFADVREFASYVSSMRNFEAELYRNPLRTLHLLMSRTGVKPTDLAAYSPDPVQEALSQLPRQLESLRQELRREPAPPAPETPAQEGLVRETAEAFAQAEDENGEKTHPYFNELAPMMALIMRRDGHEDMEKAYQEALYSLPKAREELLERERRSAAQKQAELDKAKRAEAFAARSRGTALSAAGNRKKKIDDIIAQAEQELAGQ